MGGAGGTGKVEGSWRRKREEAERQSERKREGRKREGRKREEREGRGGYGSRADHMVVGHDAALVPAVDHGQQRQVRVGLALGSGDAR